MPYYNHPYYSRERHVNPLRTTNGKYTLFSRPAQNPIQTHTAAPNQIPATTHHQIQPTPSHGQISPENSDAIPLHGTQKPIPTQNDQKYRDVIRPYYTGPKRVCLDRSGTIRAIAWDPFARDAGGCARGVVRPWRAASRKPLAGQARGLGRCRITAIMSAHKSLILLDSPVIGVRSSGDGCASGSPGADFTRWTCPPDPPASPRQRSPARWAGASRQARDCGCCPASLGRAAPSRHS